MMADKSVLHTVIAEVKKTAEDKKIGGREKTGAKENTDTSGRDVERDRDQELAAPKSDERGMPFRKYEKAN